MIKIENVHVDGWEQAIHGMRNPLNSWKKSDSSYCPGFVGGLCGNCRNNDENKRPSCWTPNYYKGKEYVIGQNDHDLMMRLAKSGTEHAKYRRMIIVYVDIIAPLYWWKEADTYKVGTVANSCSTMHTIHKKEFTLDDFSHEHLVKRTMRKLVEDIEELNFWRDIYINGGNVDDENGTIKKYLPKSKEAWWQMIQFLSTSYNQRRALMLNYEVLSAIYRQRKDHRLTEWHDFCDWIKFLPYSELITLEEK